MVFWERGRAPKVSCAAPHLLHLPQGLLRPQDHLTVCLHEERNLPEVALLSSHSECAL